MKYGRLTVVPKCPNCGKELDGYAAPSLPRGPQPGDVTVCVYCAMPSEFLEGMNRLRVIDMDRVDPEFRREIEAAIVQVRQLQAKWKAMES